MKKNELIFHIGTPKTGTTSLQEFFVSSPDMLEKMGYYYPNFGNKNVPNVNGYYFVNYPSKQNMKEHSSKQWEKLWQTIDFYLEKGNVIISNELFWNNSVKEVYRYAVDRGMNVKIVVYLRRQDLYLEAYYNQCIKSGYESDTFQSWLEKSAYQKDSSNAHYLKELMQLEEIVGRENMMIRVFEKEQMHLEKLDIINDFMRTIIPEFGEQISMNRSNERLSPDVNELKRIFNSVVTFGRSAANRDDYQQLFLQLSDVYQDSNVDKRAGYMTEKERRSLMQLYNEENQEIARRYLNRENGILFYDNNYDIPLVQINMTPGEQLITKYISMIYVQLNQKINLLAENKLVCSELLNVVKKARGERKIALFGAGFRCGFYLNMMYEDVDIIIDNDSAKWGTRIDGIKVCSSDEIQDWSQYLVIITVLSTATIEEQLQRLGLRRDVDYLIGNEYNM